MRYANLFDFWFDKRQLLRMFTFANSTVSYENWPKKF